MPKKIEPLPNNAVPTRTAIVDGREVAIFDERIFSATLDKVATCVEHVDGGVADRLLADYWGGKFELTETEGKPLLRYRIECEGCTMLGRCGIKLTQYDSDGYPVVR